MAQPRSAQHLPLSLFPPPTNPGPLPPTRTRPPRSVPLVPLHPGPTSMSEMLPERQEDPRHWPNFGEGGQRAERTGAEGTRKRPSQSPCLWRRRGRDYISHKSVWTSFGKPGKVVGKVPGLVSDCLPKRMGRNNPCVHMDSRRGQAAAFKISGSPNEMFGCESNLWQQCLLDLLLILSLYVEI